MKDKLRYFYAGRELVSIEGVTFSVDAWSDKPVRPGVIPLTYSVELNPMPIPMKNWIKYGALCEFDESHRRIMEGID